MRVWNWIGSLVINFLDWAQTEDRNDTRSSVRAKLILALPLLFVGFVILLVTEIMMVVREASSETWEDVRGTWNWKPSAGKYCLDIINGELDDPAFEGWGTKYRLLNEGEIILATDEVYNDSEWVTTVHCIGQPAPSPLYTSHRKYRRLKELLYCANCGGTNITDGSCNERGCKGSRHVMTSRSVIPNDSLLEEVRNAIEKHSQGPDLTKVCGKMRPQNPRMLGGPKYICTMPKDHKGQCYQTQEWSTYC